MENNVNNIDFLDELKQDYQLVTKKLESQRINNERLLRTVMKNKMKGIHQVIYLELLILLPILGLSILYLYNSGMISMPLALISVLYGVMGVIFDFRINKVKGGRWLEGNLLDSRTILLKMKQLRSKQMLYSCVALVFIFIFYAYDLYTHLQGYNHITSMIVGSSIGGFIGFLIAYFIYKKAQRTNDELIEEIDRLKNE
ncbi:hypothetical protein [Phocaeicola vulgatus]|uniref:hypothetical protein n=1 Tax=Phocaeicola vulgatus TaxID=821 RepID=UPI003DA22E2A